MENEWIVVDRYSNDVWPCTTEEEANNTAEKGIIRPPSATGKFQIHMYSERLVLMVR